MINLLRPIIARLAGALAAFLVAWLTRVIGPDLFGADFTAHLTEVILSLGIAAYSLVHRLIQRWIDPEDRAKPEPLRR